MNEIQLERPYKFSVFPLMVVVGIGVVAGSILGLVAFNPYSITNTPITFGSAILAASFFVSCALVYALHQWFERRQSAIGRQKVTHLYSRLQRAPEKVRHQVYASARERGWNEDDGFTLFMYWDLYDVLFSHNEERGITNDSLLQELFVNIEGDVVSEDFVKDDLLEEMPGNPGYAEAAEHELSQEPESSTTWRDEAPDWESTPSHKSYSDNEGSMGSSSSYSDDSGGDYGGSDD